MEPLIETTAEWNIKTSIGPITFNIFANYALFICDEGNSIRHKHATYEFHFIDKGNGFVNTDDNQYEILPDSYFIIKAGIYHKQRVTSPESINRCSFRFDYDIADIPDDSYSSEEIRDFLYALSNIHCFYSTNFSRIRHIISAIQSELAHEEMGYYTKVQHLFSLLFIDIFREISAEGLHGRKAPRRVYHEDRVNIIDKFFDQNYDYKATSQELCRLLNISDSQLNRILKEKYNMTFKKKHMEAQIEHIKYMLINTDLPIGVIVEKMGYTSEDNFIAFFRNATGISPKTFRNSNK